MNIVRPRTQRFEEVGEQSPHRSRPQLGQAGCGKVALSFGAAQRSFERPARLQEPTDIADKLLTEWATIFPKELAKACSHGAFACAAKENGKRVDPLAKIVRRRPVFRRARIEIVEVIEELEGNSEVVAKARKSASLGHGHLRSVSPDECGQLEQAGRLSGRDANVVGWRALEAPRPFDLAQLAVRNPKSDHAKPSRERRRKASYQLIGQAEELGAAERGHPSSVPNVCCGDATSRQRTIDDVIVIEGSNMRQLDRKRSSTSAVPIDATTERLAVRRAEKQEAGAKELSASA
jgi:hypothetical protein